MVQKLFAGLIALYFIVSPIVTSAQADFNPHFIISDPELEDNLSWSKADVQQFLVGRGSYLATYYAEDASGTIKMASDIIYEASQRYKINPKFLLVTLQKEQSLITDDAPSDKQLNWATGYAVCDSCSMEDPKVLKFKGFGKQVDNAAGIMRWYYDNKDRSYVKKKDYMTMIDNQEVSPQSWATAFLYTYTPHLSGNRNFWRIWNTWFEQVYPNGTVLAAGNGDYWLVQNGIRRKFRNKTALITRTDPKNAVKVTDVELSNYKIGSDLSFANYSVLQTPSLKTYLVDYDTIRPFESDEVVRRLGFNPQEIIPTEEADLEGYTIGTTITASSTALQGVIYNVTDLKSFYLLKDNVLYPIVDQSIISANYKDLPVEKRKAKDLTKFETALPITFRDGTLLKEKDRSTVYVMDSGKKRPIADDDTFISLGYKRSNIVAAVELTLLNIPTGETLFINKNYLSSKNKFLGDIAGEIPDLYKKNNLASYVVAEYPSGRIVTGKNIDSRRSIASLTKLLTAYEAINNDFNLTKTTVYQPDKYSSEGNPLAYAVGDKVKNKDVWNAMLVASNNSSARMVAQGTNLSENQLVIKINERLEEWGADNTTIADVTGLDEKNKSTARDMLKIFTKVLENETIKRSLGEPTYTFKKTSAKNKVASKILNNTNQIIKNVPFAKRSYKILATKTGYTVEADATLLMLVEDKRTKKQYIVVTLGNPDYTKRFEEPHQLAEWLTYNYVRIATP